jgi:NAD+ synthase
MAQKASRAPRRRNRLPSAPARSAPTGLEIDPRIVCSALERFIRDETRRAGTSGVVIGLSGGIDSALSATLAVRALGTQNVTGALLPYHTSNPDSGRDAGELARSLKIRHERVDITPMVDAYFASRPDADRLRRGNKMARERMSILYDLSVVHRALVLGTSNKTEILLGYGTLYGDTACALNAIGDLYKTQVRALAEFVGVPEKIRRKPPSADLWPDQTDEGELGYSYDDLDRLLVLLIDQALKPAEVEARGFARRMVRDVLDRVERNRFKSRPSLIAKVTGHSVGVRFS